MEKEGDIPIDVIKEVFYNDSSDNTSSSSSSNDLNDYTVIQTKDYEYPKDKPISKYPKFQRKPIKNHIPSVYYAKKTPSPKEEYVPPVEKKSPRKINISNVSEIHRELATKPLHQRIKQIIKETEKSNQVQKQIQMQEKQHQEFELNQLYIPKELIPEDIPEIYKRNEEAIHKRREKAYRKDQRRIQKQAMKDEALNDYFSHEKERVDQNRRERLEKAEENRRIQAQEELRLKRLAYQKYKDKLFSDRPTRASQLKKECCIKKQKKHEEMRKAEIKDKMRRKEISRKYTKRLQEVLDQYNAPIKSYRVPKMREEMREHERYWKEWLELTKEKNDNMLVMLERYLCDMKQPKLEGM
ncbi:hypothetical protein GPJ56_003934 [Histomonas meleagridis]|uniref:uncharacterized protein n=1 Tax=Histomonas meleagridis TaxID=135588 RepID=UPI00355A9426|nr:hypothetical protein GPJ56_003934 [Histomonas meleagridis]KAH0797523.1 hypothetical protein GO595_009626 [Histomonas meleagridis]